MLLDWEKELEVWLHTTEQWERSIAAVVGPYLEEIARANAALEQVMTEMVDPHLEGWLGGFEQWGQQVDHYLYEAMGTMEGEFNRPVDCQGCRFYHGRYYEGTQLVCALHPEGPQASCRDWEGS
ncbi:hypothetical protein [Anthocerotibacter panamensis]|uniref:hypothetical protein n=1 Tax=Anthocerotibacter panamensis TaxID=2857077 RepID=UPI001C408B40|nr:hypothetical protein [Anthocerotibacter panamensis]